MRRELWTLRFRRRREQAPGRRRLRWAAGAAQTLLAVLGVALALTAPWLATAYAALTRSLPHPEALARWVAFPQGVVYRATVLTDRYGQPLPGPQPVVGAFLLNEQVPEPTRRVFQGVLAQTWQTDPDRAVARALAAHWLLHDARGTPWQVRLLGGQLLSHYGADLLWQWYFNSVPLGHDLYGLDAAAQRYFGHSARTLDWAESVALAALAVAPRADPLTDPEEVAARLREWTERLRRAGVLTPAEAAEATQKALTWQQAPSPVALPWPLQAALTQAVQATDWPLPTRGLRVRATVDAALQDQAACLARTVAQGQLEADCPAALQVPPSALGQPLPEGSRLELVVLDARTGQVLAQTTYPHPAPRAYPPGTALLPWVYLTAFARGMAPATLTWDVPAALPPGVEATNPDGRFHGPIAFRTALANGYLVPALDLMARLGPDTVWATAREVGLPLPDPEGRFGLRVLLDAGGLFLRDVAYALEPLATLGTLAGQPTRGERLGPVAVMSVYDAHNTPLLDWQRPRRQAVLSAGLAYLVTDVLRDAPARWPSLGHPNPLEIGRPVAAYVGRADGGRVIWALGYTPQRVIGVVVESEPGRAEDAALALWRALALYALRDLPVEDWVAPPEVGTVAVCSPSGLLPTPDCPTVVEEVFLLGNEPTAPDTLYRRVAVNRETGRLATVFTPPELIEERVYIQVPPEARAWAEQAGLPLPPTEYDLVAPPTPDPQVRLTAPTLFAYVRGQVRLEGTADGPQFAAYRVQVGQGLNPTAWVTVAEGESPVRQGVLGLWDTRSLDGLYTVQLQVTTVDRRVLTHTIQVTVDNTPPRVAWRPPLPEEQVSYREGEVLLLAATAEDDYGVAYVRLLVNGREVGRRAAPPYTFAWPLRVGRWTFTVEAVDAAGNTASVEHTLQVDR